MKIALLGGNGYQYAFQPSYVHANGRGYISGDQLLGATAKNLEITPERAHEIADSLRAQGEPVPADIATLERQYKGERAYNVVDKGLDLATGLFNQFTGKKTPASTPQMQKQATDNTALIITGAVAGVAVLAVMMTGKKRRRRR